MKNWSSGADERERERESADFQRGGTDGPANQSVAGEAASLNQSAAARPTPCLGCLRVMRGAGVGRWGREGGCSSELKSLGGSGADKDTAAACSIQRQSPQPELTRTLCTGEAWPLHLLHRTLLLFVS